VTEPAVAAPDARGPRSKRHRFGWVAELVGMALIYEAYDTLRDTVAGSTHAAFIHARQIVAAERFVGLYWERDIQRPFLHLDWFISFWNIYYGTIHFVMPAVALVWMYRKAPVRYVRWRNTLVLMFALAIFSFWVYPLAPPRIMPDHYGFIDTAAHYFNFGPQVPVRFVHGHPDRQAMASFGNLYAAMPSFHVGWSTWSILALWPLVRRWWGKVLLVVYPLTILFCIVVTANHWLLDAVGGWAVLAAGYAGAWLLDRVTGAWRTRRAGGTPVSRAASSEPAGV